MTRPLTALTIGAVALAALAAGPAPADAGPFIDTDGDGLDDGWEMSYFGNITSQDQFGDPDGDGVNNLQEYTGQTNPLVYDGPNAPTPASPMCGSEVHAGVVFIAGNATDPQGTPLQYEFALYSDPGLSIEVAHSLPLVEQGAGATTSWTVGVNLVEHTRYWWRARARDQFVFGPWSAPACSFFVNSVNDPPLAPRINSPAFGAQVHTLMPSLVIDNGTDPDQDILRYQYQVFADAPLTQLVAQTMAPHVAEGAAGTTTWQVAGGNLMEDHAYFWRARGCDPDNLCGPWSATGEFFLTVVNSAPEPPAIITPQHGSLVADLRPSLVVLNSDDVDRDPLVYDWDLALDATFQNLLESGPNSPRHNAQSTIFLPSSDLEENGRYCWRVRSDDGAATSAYSVACFMVSERNDPPFTPVLRRPEANAVVPTTTPIFSWQPSLDPEGESILYELEILDADGAPVSSAAGIASTVTPLADDLLVGQSYTWRARAVDGSGAASDWSPARTLTVSALPADDDGCCTSDGGCQSTGTAPGPAAGLAFSLSLLALAPRRRRRH